MAPRERLLVLSMGVFLGCLYLRRTQFAREWSGGWGWWAGQHYACRVFFFVFFVAQLPCHMRGSNVFNAFAVFALNAKNYRERATSGWCRIR